MYKNISWLWIHLCILLIFLSGGIRVGAFLGINWGRDSTQRLVPSVVVDLLLQNGIRELRLHTPSFHVLDALIDTNIVVSTAAHPVFLRTVKDQKRMDEYVNERVKYYFDRGVKFRHFYVGNEPFTTLLYKGSQFKNIVNFLNMARDSLDKFGLHDIKAITPHFTDVLVEVAKPSQGVFRESIKDNMIEFLDFLNKTGGPFVIHVFPTYTTYRFGFDPEFAFFDNKSKFKIKDGKITYYNVFTFIYDTLIYALRKVGYGDMEIIVGQIGWPTDGYIGANEDNAERFYRGLLNYMARKEGTPLRPKRDISVYLRSLTDENRIPLDFGPFQRHWGIYRHDGIPKYKIDFSMQDKDIMPPVAKGTVRMPRRWCMFDGKTDHNETLVLKDYDFACSYSDCSVFAGDTTCNDLTFPEKVSYAYNMRYQMKNQNLLFCELIGAKVSTTNPSALNCEFPTEILTVEIMDNGAGLKMRY